MRYKTLLCAIATMSCCIASITQGQTTSNVQATARPFGLEIVDTVKLAGSDSRSASFQSNDLSYFNDLIDTSLGETASLPNVSSMQLDPSRLTLKTDYSVRTYFVGEGAGYHNTLGFSTTNAQGQTSQPEQLIFPDVSSSVSYFDPAATATRSSSMPLLQGDFVDLGTVQAGETLDFFLIADGARRGRNKWGADASKNVDGLQHVVAFAKPGSPYLLVGFEDLYNGGDLDYNDALFVVDVGTANVQKLVGAPEPTTLAMMSVIGIGLGFRRWRRPKGRPTTKGS